MKNNNLMQAYIDEQATVIFDMVNRRKEITGEFIRRFADADIERILLFGSGSSGHAGQMAQPMMEKALGIEVTTAIPTQMPDTFVWKEKQILYIAVSQGGKSTNTYHEILKLKQEGKPTVSITEDANSPIAESSNLTLTIPIGKENIGAKTKGVTASVLMLMLMALELGKARGTVSEEFETEIISGLIAISKNMPDNISRCKIWFNNNKVELAESNYMMFLSEKANRSAGSESALKLLETIYRPVFSYEFEEFLHGVQNSLNEKSFLFYLMQNSDKRERWLRMYHVGEECGAKSYVIYGGDPIEDRKNFLHLNTTGCNYLSCFEFLLPAQVLSAQLSAYCGIDITVPKYADFASRLASKLG